MKKIFFFDFDGVIVDSLKNMEISWHHVCKKFQINKPFELYKRQIGKPFNVILDNLEIYENQKLIMSEYENTSLLYIDEIRLVENTKIIFTEMDNKSITRVLYTSKSLKRLDILLKKFNLKFSKIYCPGRGRYLKPDPEPINFELQNNNLSREDAIFIGDSENDYLTSVNSEIDYLNAEWGYEKLNSVKKIYNILDLRKYF